MFGWGSREIRLRLGDVQKRLEESQEMRRLDKSFLQAVGDFKENVSALLESVGALGEKTSGSKYSDVVKNRFCARAVELLQEMRYPEGVLRAEEFGRELKERLSGLGSLNIKEFRHLSAFRDGMKAVADGIRAVENSASALGKILGQPVSRDAMRTGAIMVEIEDCEQSIASLREQERLVLSEISGTMNGIKSKRKELQDALGSGEYARAAAMRDEIGRLSRSAETIERKISEEFAQIDRVFRKFSHANAYEAELVKKYVDDGFSAFLDDEGNKVKIILDKMRVEIESGKISIETRKHQKLLDILRSMSLFQSLRAQYKELKSRANEMSGDMPTIERDAERMRSEIESLEENVAKLGKDAENRSRSADAMQQKIHALRSELADAAGKVLGKKVILED